MKKALLLPLPFALAFGAAFGVTNAIDDDPPVAAQVTTTSGDRAETVDHTGGAVVPVIAPIAVNVDPASLDDPPPTDLPETVPPAGDDDGVPVSRAVSELRDRSTGGAAPTEPTSEDLAASLDDAIGAGLASADDVGVSLFVDPCAGDEPGAGSDEPECDGGVGSTVLAIRSPAAMQVVLLLGPEHIDATIPGWRRCEFPGGDGMTGVIVSNNPVTSGDIEVAELYDIAATRRTVSLAATSADEQTRWDRLVNYPEHWWEEVQQCVRIPSLDAARGTQLRITAHVTGVGGDDTDLKSYTVPEDRDRPPVAVSFSGANHAEVVVPVIHNRMFATITPIAAIGEGAGTCEDYEAAAGAPEGSTGWPGVETGRRLWPEERLDTAVLAQPDYPYDPKFNVVKHLSLELDEGAAYLFCIRWFLQSSSFDDEVLVEREQRLVAFPDRRRLTVRILGYELARAGEPGVFSFAVRGPDGDQPRLEIRNESTGTCGASLPVERVPAGRTMLADPLTLCGTGGHVDDLPWDSIDLYTSVRGADTQKVRVAVDLSGAARNELYRVGITGNARLCGYSCDSAPRDDYGAVFVEVVLEEGATDGFADGLIAPPSPWTGPRAPRSERPEDAQLDLFSDLVVDADGNVLGDRARTYAHPLEGTTDTLRVELVVDRNVAVRAIAESAGGGEPCLAEGAGEDAGEGRALVEGRVPSHVDIAGLCARTAYAIRLELTDDTGHETRFEAGAEWWSRTTTFGVEAEFVLNAFIEHDNPTGGGNIGILRGIVRLDGQPVDFRWAGPHEYEHSNRCVNDVLHYMPRTHLRGFYGDTVTVEVDFELGYYGSVADYNRDEIGRCYRDRPGEPEVRHATIIVPVQELFSGRFEYEVKDESGFGVRITLGRGEVRAGWGYGYS